MGYRGYSAVGCIMILALSRLAGVLPAQGQWGTRAQPTAPPCS
jgi:hypothetical protein